jgi:hypothetical protein
MSAKYFFETTDSAGDYVAFDIDRVVGFCKLNGETIVMLDTGGDPIRQSVSVQPEAIMKAVRSYSVRP